MGIAKNRGDEPEPNVHITLEGHQSCPYLSACTSGPEWFVMWPAMEFHLSLGHSWGPFQPKVLHDNKYWLPWSTYDIFAGASLPFQTGEGFDTTLTVCRIASDGTDYDCQISRDVNGNSISFTVGPGWISVIGYVIVAFLALSALFILLSLGFFIDSQRAHNIRKAQKDRSLPA